VLDLAPEPTEVAAAATIAGHEAPGEVEAPAEEVAPAAEELEPQVIGVAPGQSLDEAIAAYEAMIAAEEVHAAGQEVDTPVVGLVGEPPPAEVEAQPDTVSALGARAQPESRAMSPRMRQTRKSRSRRDRPLRAGRHAVAGTTRAADGRCHRRRSRPSPPPAAAPGPTCQAHGRTGRRRRAPVAGRAAVAGRRRPA
jgi:hypothetical protein